MNTKLWQFWIDVGGTFTDCVTSDPNENESQIKVLSSGMTKGSAKVESPRELATKLVGQVDGYWKPCSIRVLYADGSVAARTNVSASFSNGRIELHDAIDVAIGSQVFIEIDAGIPSPILAIHLLTRTPIAAALPASEVFLGTTKGTNALLTRSGARTALVTSSGLRDFLTIGDQARQGLFDLVARKSPPLFETAIEIKARMLADGTEESVVDPAEVRSKLKTLKQSGIESLAICFIHSYQFPAHEQQVADIARSIGFSDVRTSSDLAALIKLQTRGETTVLDAYLNPVIRSYLDQIVNLLGPNSQLKLMTSAGALTTRELFFGKDSVLSGPAGGAVGSARISQQIGFEKSIGFDMGGTSTDVSRFDGHFEIEYESQKAGVRIMTPMMSIETVAAGGGSICHFDGTRLLVGPKSAGSDPGPACYGSGGPLTVTDINLFLGRLDEKQFPFELNSTAVKIQLEKIASELAAHGKPMTALEIAAGFSRIANHNMALAIQNVSAAKGVDPREYLLTSFGGAGGQHCCGVADSIGIRKILVHPQCSILSALGIQLSDQSHSQAVSILQELNESTKTEVIKKTEVLKQKVSETLERFDLLRDKLEFEHSVDLRYLGTDTTINIKFDDVNALAQQFSDEHLRLFGYVRDRKIEIVSARVHGISRGTQLSPCPMVRKPTQCKAVGEQKLFCNSKFVAADRFDWDRLEPGNEIFGPAIVGNALTATVVDHGWKASVLDQQQLLLERVQIPTSSKTGYGSIEPADPIELEIFNKKFEAIADKMGHVLSNTAISVNVKQRLDFSCALFSKEGDLVVNAPHIPVHLGAMSETVKSTIRLNDVREGDVFVTNDPYQGGSHLPDITVLTPVFVDSSKPEFWVASRAHHAEIGGIAPGSMPANAERLQQEGVIIQNMRLVDRGVEQFEKIERALRSSPFPSRNPSENLADLTAQIAANQSGANALRELTRTHSLAKVQAYMGHIRLAAETKTRNYLAKFPDGIYTGQDAMDDGTTIRVELKIKDNELAIDFSGTDPIHAGNLNANPAIVSSATMYVIRCLLQEDIPMNSGILKPIAIQLPVCFLNPAPREPHGDSPAVVGGNVETSQRIVDVLFSAFQIVAASHGTMNNWLIGNSEFGYYETVGGGAGAGHGTPGCDAVHCHMSNTRLTDPEILETRYPMILREFRVRDQSGGRGEFAGGNGMIREIEFRAPLTLSLLTSRRTTQPPGICGGDPAMPGENILIQGGTRTTVPSQCQCEVNRGDRLRLLTPGGGGFGREPQ